MKSLSSKRNEKGQGLVEYALILVLVGIVVIGSLTVLGPKVGQVFSDINNSIAGVDGCPAGQYSKDLGDGIFCIDDNSGLVVGPVSP